MEVYEVLDFKSGDLLFASKEHNPPCNVHAEKKSHAEIKAAVLRSPRIKKTIRDVAEEYGCAMTAVEKETEAILEEIGHKLSLPSVRFVALLLRSVLRKVLSGIYVNKAGLSQLSSLCREWPVVLVPSHRSYLDFILVSYVMLEHNLPLPCIAAGLDFMNMAGVSTLLRHCGAFFLRRTFGSDQLYKATFSEYVKTLLCSRESPMEFFVEGTRSRSGKSLHPRLGLLSMVIEPYLEGRVPDIMMVPVSISYERTLEELLFAREQLGVPKPKESTSGLFKAYSLLSENYGSIFVNIGEATSVHNFCVKHGISRVPHTLVPKEASLLLPAEWRMVKELGHHIVDCLHAGMNIFPSAVVAATLLSSTHTSWFIDVLEEWVDWVSKQLLHRGATISPLQTSAAASAVTGLEKLEAGVRMLGINLSLKSSDGLIQVPLVPHPVPASSLSTHDTSSSCDAPSSSSCHKHAHPTADSNPRLPDLYGKKLEKESLEKLLDVSHVHLSLGHYRNQLLHVFLLDSLLALSVEEEIECATASERHEVLLSSLASEFVFPLQTSKEIFDDGVDRFVKRGLLTLSDDRKSLLLQACHDSDRLLNFLRSLVLPFAQCMYVVCHQLLSLKGGVQSLSGTVKHVQMLAATSVQYGVVESYEVMSLSVIKNGLASLHQTGLILQASNEYGTGHDRLVQVINEPRLLHTTKILGEICGMQDFPKSQL